MAAAMLETIPVVEPIPAETSLRVFRRMLAAYYVEERLMAFAKQGKCTFVASPRGHEATQIGITELLCPGHDWFFPYYRSRGTVIGLGMPLDDIFAGMLNREGDPNSAGRNMPEHFSSRRLKLVSQTACTGSQYLPAVGAARAIKLAGGDEIVYVESGEGATSEGEFFEALNWASREELPVLFVVQNNGYAISVPQKSQTRSTVRQIAKGFGVHAVEVDGTSFRAIHQTLPALISELRAGRGPVLVEAKVVRIDPHSNSDDHKKYRTFEEILAASQRDPVLIMEQEILSAGLMDAGRIARLREEVRKEVDAAADRVGARPFPDPAHVMDHLFAADQTLDERSDIPAISTEPVAMIDAINHALREEMTRNPKIQLWGEDVADPKGGVFGVTRGLTDAFPGQVFNSPLAEASIAGVAGGMAIAGYKPIIEMQFGDYLWPAAQQLRDEIPTVRWRSNGEWTCPVVLRIAVGGYIKGGPWHSACVEGFFAHIPGWRVVFPSCARDAKGLMKAAARSGDPVVFLEHKGLYRRVQAKDPEPGPDFIVPFGKGRVRREGSDLTIVTWGSTVYTSLEVARQMELQGRSLEVIDLRSIAPFDEDLIYRSVRKTNRVIVAYEDSLTMGFGAEIAARIAENAVDALDAPVRRVAARDLFVPSAPNLELAVLPSVEGLRAAVEETLRY